MAVVQPRLTAAEYLAREEGALEKSELVQGEVFAMAGGSIAHAQISSNLVYRLRTVPPRECTALGSDIKVQAADDTFLYPDCVVVCGEPESSPHSAHAIVNPLIIVEVLSPSTLVHDTRVKLPFCMAMPSVEHIVFVSQTSPVVDLYSRREDPAWLYTRAAGLDKDLVLDNPSMRICLAGIYDRVVFEAVAEPPHPGSLPPIG